jgi:hypothetical protein
MLERIALLRGQITALEFLAMEPQATPEFGTSLLAATNKILDSALDLSKTAAKVERAARDTGGIYER